MKIDHFPFHMSSAVQRVKVRCNQTGKVSISSVEQLADEAGDPVCSEEMEEGVNVLWIDDTEEAYPVTFLRILANSKPIYRPVHVMVECIQNQHTQVLLLCMGTCA